MIRITLLYRRAEGSRFDFDYYVNHHISMARRLLADYGLTSIEVEKCIRAADGGEPDLFCISHIDFENEKSLTKALEVHGEELQADFPKYTNITPEIYICDVLGNVA